MPFVVVCEACTKRLNIPDLLFESKIRGRVVTIGCKQCGADIRVDGTREQPGVSAGDPAPVASAPTSSPPEVSPIPAPEGAVSPVEPAKVEPPKVEPPKADAQKPGVAAKGEPAASAPAAKSSPLQPKPEASAPAAKSSPLQPAGAALPAKSSPLQPKPEASAPAAKSSPLRPKPDVMASAGKLALGRAGETPKPLGAAKPADGKALAAKVELAKSGAGEPVAGKHEKETVPEGRPAMGSKPGFKPAEPRKQMPSSPLGGRPPPPTRPRLEKSEGVPGGGAAGDKPAEAAPAFAKNTLADTPNPIKAGRAPSSPGAGPARPRVATPSPMQPKAPSAPAAGAGGFATAAGGFPAAAGAGGPGGFARPVLAKLPVTASIAGIGGKPDFDIRGTSPGTPSALRKPESPATAHPGAGSAPGSPVALGGSAAAPAAAAPAAPGATPVGSAIAPSIKSGGASGPSVLGKPVASPFDATPSQLGTDAWPPALSGSAHEAMTARPPADSRGTVLLWAVSYADDDDRELTQAEIQRALEAGEIDGETIVWREGMADWLPLREVPELGPLLVQSSLAARDAMASVSGEPVDPAHLAAAPAGAAGAYEGPTLQGEHVSREVARKVEQRAATGAFEDPTVRAPLGVLSQLASNAVAPNASGAQLGEAPAPRPAPPVALPSAQAIPSIIPSLVPTARRGRMVAFVVAGVLALLVLAGVGLLISLVLSSGEDPASDTSYTTPSAAVSVRAPSTPTAAASQEAATAEPEGDVPLADLASAIEQNVDRSGSGKGPVFDKSTAQSQLRAAAGRATLCRKKGEEQGPTNVIVKFEPESGRAVEATVSPPYAGTATGKCIEMEMKSIRVRPFGGAPVTMRQRVMVR